MSDFIPTQLRFAAIAGFSVRADFEGGAVSSNFGALVLHGVDRQTGLIARLASAIEDRRHPSYINHSLTELLRQRIFQSACGYADGNDANSLRHDPVFKLAAGRAPLDTDNALASGPTFSRLENSLSRKDIYRLARAFVDAFIASYASAPAAIVLDMDHSEDRTHGQQELSFYNHHYGSHCCLPLFLFEGLSGKFITAVLRPGKRPTGRENAAIIARVVRRLRQAWPDTHIVLRGDGHFSNPELMALCEGDEHMDFIFGLPGNKVLTPKAQPLLAKARALRAQQCERARLEGQAEPAATRLYDEVVYRPTARRQTSTCSTPGIWWKTPRARWWRRGARACAASASAWTARPKRMCAASSATRATASSTIRHGSPPCWRAATPNWRAAEVARARSCRRR